MIPPTEIQAPNFVDLPWLDHGFGLRDSAHPPDIVTLKQIHSGIVLDAAETRPGQEGDAILSIATGIRIGVKTADCVPILLVDAETRAVAAIHAGWRGTAANIVQAAISEMSTRWKTAPENLRAAIGPSIGVCCYEVGPEVARQFGTWMPKMQRIEGSTRLDLPAINEKQLRDAGVADIWTSRECTFCGAERFFSFRREREQAGRMLSFIGLR